MNGLDGPARRRPRTETRPGREIRSGDWKGTMPDPVRRFLDEVTAKGYTVARLEDYL